MARSVHQVVGRRLVEAQDTGQCLEDLDRRVTVAALLKPQVVVRADPGEQGDLLAPQPGVLLIPGTSSIAHLRDNVTGAALTPPGDELAELNGIAAEATAAR
jgi:hypothetical protein